MSSPRIKAPTFLMASSKPARRRRHSLGAGGRPSFCSHDNSPTSAAKSSISPVPSPTRAPTQSSLLLPLPFSLLPRSPAGHVPPTTATLFILSRHHGQNPSAPNPNGVDDLDRALRRERRRRSGDSRNGSHGSYTGAESVARDGSSAGKVPSSLANGFVEVCRNSDRYAVPSRRNGAVVVFRRLMGL